MRRKGITPGAFLMVIVAVSFLVFAAATRFGLDLIGPQVVDLIERVHDATGWYEGARSADR
jgi:hypothetical protein